MSNVENLNKQLGRLINGYLNTKEEQTGQIYKEWLSIIPTIRTELNKIRVFKPALNPDYVFKTNIPEFNFNYIIKNPPKFKTGNLVHVKLEVPKNALNNKQTTQNFRMGDYRIDKVPRKIKKVLFYVGRIPYRYIIEGLENASYTENEIIPSKEKEEKYEIKKIIGHKKINNKLHYLIWWRNHLKNQSTYEPADVIRNDAPLLVKQYHQSLN